MGRKKNPLFILLLNHFPPLLLPCLLLLLFYFFLLFIHSTIVPSLIPSFLLSPPPSFLPFLSLLFVILTYIIHNPSCCCALYLQKHLFWGRKAFFDWRSFFWFTIFINIHYNPQYTHITWMDLNETICSVQALYDYTSTDHASLSFGQGDIIHVLAKLESGWWDGW